MSIVANRLAVILSRAWWVLLLRGVVAIAFGALTWFQPGITLAALVMIFGAYTLVDGGLGAWAGIAGRKEDEERTERGAGIARPCRRAATPRG